GMGNREGSLASRQSTFSDISSSSHSRPSGCPYRPTSGSRSSTDSEPSTGGSTNNNNNSNSSSGAGGCPMSRGSTHKASVRSMLQGGCPDLEVLQAASHKMAPMKQRKVSRAASAGRIRTRRSFKSLPGMGALSSKTEVMSDDMKSYVQEIWHVLHSIVPSATQIGCGIYQRIFESAPELRSVFRIPDDVLDLSTFEPFHRSAKLFVSVIDLCVRSIFTLECEMGPVLVMYGRRHYHYLFDFQYQQEDSGFRGVHLPIFAQSIFEFIFTTLPEQDRGEEGQLGWQLLLGYINSKISEGYELEKHRNASLRRKSAL
ncbi:glb-23, partial [Pristionchus pacificus]|uniref:Globin domain-containing protein n=1 Tax=Pristionchus pacificus TaxID=54126 RepID=A0A8R1V303_PRIPA